MNLDRRATFLTTNLHLELVQVTREIIASLAGIQWEKGGENGRREENEENEENEEKINTNTLNQSWSQEEKVCSIFCNVYAFSCCMCRISLCFFSGDEVSEKVTLSRNFKERVVQPILKVNIPLAINCNKRGKHFRSDKLQQTWVYEVEKNE